MLSGASWRWSLRISSPSPVVDGPLMSGVRQREEECDLRAARVGQDGLRDAAVLVGEGPTGAQADQHAAGADGDVGGGRGGSA